MGDRLILEHWSENLTTIHRKKKNWKKIEGDLNQISWTINREKIVHIKKECANMKRSGS